jgi:hypothetical protein
MNVKSVNKTVIEITKQEIIDELVNNFKELTKDLGNDLLETLDHAEYVFMSLTNIKHSKYSELFKDGGSLKCLPEEVFNKVEEYFFGDEDDEEDNSEAEGVISFKKASQELRESELEIAIKDKGKVVARISEHEIQY